MRIALDYDGTFTEDPDMWEDFIQACEIRGHSVSIVTMRYDHEDEHLLDFKIPIIYTGRRAKKVFCNLNKIFFDVWIDDSPEWLFNDSR